MISSPSASSHPNDSIRVYLSAPSATGSDGKAAQLVFDTTSSVNAVEGAALSAGKIEPAHEFIACIQGKVRFTGDAGLTDVHAYLYLEPAGGDGDVLLDHAQSQAGPSGVYELRLFAMPMLSAGDKLRLDVQSDGAGSVVVNAGNGVSYLEMRSI